jgi:hypothetical protein
MIRRSVAIERWFSGDITLTDYERHSHPTPSYNCIAYAAGDLFEWWQAGAYWPLDLYPADKLVDLINAYVAVGFKNCGMNGLPEEGFEKVALYQGNDSKWTHAARLRPDGWWESKIGEFDDILHKTPMVLEGGKYGKVACYMKRTLADAIRARIAARKRARENGKW